VFFEDGTFQEFDMIIYATGYKITFPFLKHITDFDIEETNDIRLYKKVIHPKYKDLFFVGLLQPLGAIMPLSEVQSKWIARIIKGEISLPNQQKMEDLIEKETKKIQNRYTKRARHTLQVDFHSYKSDLEKNLK
jgi:hypothetical protein